MFLINYLSNIVYIYIMVPKLIDYTILEKEINNIIFNKNSLLLNIGAIILFIILAISILVFSLKPNKNEVNNKIMNKLQYISNISNNYLYRNDNKMITR